MEIIKHFSHEHRLFLKDVPKADESQVIICCGCEKPISQEGEPAYVCGECSGGYFLHKVCAELPREIMHPKHDKHSLILLPKSLFPAYTTTCDVCDGVVRTGFSYKCEICNFVMDIPCALKDDMILWAFKNRIITHDGHEHPLIFQPRPAFVRCDACGVEDKDVFYLCSSCPFLIHKNCASIPSSAKREEDDHILYLVYGLPSDYLDLGLDCDICHQRISPLCWLYCCRLCRFFVHLKCMTTRTRQNGNNLDDDLRGDDLFRLPVPDTSEMIERFLVRTNGLSHIQPEMKQHWGHKQHPLVLIHEQPNDDDEEEVDEEVLCNCCITPISAPYYTCVKCSYFLHLPCANIPFQLQHHSHSHALTLKNYKNLYNEFRCNNCDQYSNGFFFMCDTYGDFFLDVKCAALPTTIVHENHNHPLFQFKASNSKLCNACNSEMNGLAFGCRNCNFSLHHKCAMLPKAIRHRWDKHPLPLRFPPYSDHPEDFICDICEEKIHPKFWLYHCSDCNINSFHLYCVPRLGRFLNHKFGGKLEVSSHPHPLEFKRKATLKSSCDGCGDNINRYAAFECEDCNFCLCVGCIRNVS